MTFLPSGKTAIGCRWVFKRKDEAIPIVDQDLADDNNQSRAARRRGEREQMKIRTRYKARLVAKGFEQQYGVDFWAIFSPTPHITTFRILVALAAYFGWDMHQLDIITAFLNADLDSEVYMEIPLGMEALVRAFLILKDLNPDSDLGENRPVLQLRKSLYGLKQSPLEWNKDIDRKLKKLCFRQCKADPSLYIPTFENGCFLLLYVDDILLVGPTEGINNVKQIIRLLYKFKDLGPARLFLKIKIERLSESQIKISQTCYIEKL